ncbi:hypothetical protein FGO68_gene15530 [Halteria grandinella]|uniref:Uncharacterized protein n=1 Tax=Halteria grandinella TaxID=5974 RepID=A0A8J8T3E8_HALGN|nr:hypothetical protein FGO68_gene15530 [Halteria grandinella]
MIINSGHIIIVNRFISSLIIKFLNHNGRLSMNKNACQFCLFRIANCTQSHLRARIPDTIQSAKQYHLGQRLQTYSLRTTYQR